MKKILLILSTIIFISCDEKLGIEKEYTVKNKIIEDERTERVIMPFKIGKVFYFMNIPVSVPKKYFIEVEYIEYKKIEVSKEEYEKIKIGEKKDFNIDKYEKELETYLDNLK